VFGNSISSYSQGLLSIWSIRSSKNSSKYYFRFYSNSFSSEIPNLMISASFNFYLSPFGACCLEDSFFFAFFYLTLISFGLDSFLFSILSAFLQASGSPSPNSIPSTPQYS